MSLLDGRRAALIAIACSALSLTACTISPVHQSSAWLSTDPLPLAYASPDNRLEQVFYQALAARLGTAMPDSAPVVTAKVSVSASGIGLSSRAEPASSHQVVATVRYSVEREGQILAAGTRTATAQYRTTGQIVADDAARANADEEAVRATAQSVIAALIADPALR